ncbi:MAG: cupin domain-containing protein [Sphingobacteriales bacterium]|nr:MAG: cupin domain-containing protein [Sphingobacteriales bacterium]
MLTARYFIEQLNLQPHVEGGYYTETYRSPVKTGDRSLSTAIYFLLEGEQLSRFHQLTADEIWFFHYGDALLVHQIDTDGNLSAQKLGINLAEGELPQLLIPAGTIFASEMSNKNSFALVSCMVSPGFEFDDFKLFDKEELRSKYPQHEAAISRLAI